MTHRPFTATSEPADLPGLRRRLAAAASAAADEYDVSTQLVRLVERQRFERSKAVARHRMQVVLSAAAAAVILVGAAAAALYRPHLPGTAAPPAKQVAAELQPGTWRATIDHLHRNPPGGTRSLAAVSFTIGPDASATLRLPDVDEPIEVRYEQSGAVLRFEADPAACPGSLVLQLSGTVRADRFTVADAEAGPCYADPAVAAELVNATFTRQEQR